LVPVPSSAPPFENNSSEYKDLRFRIVPQGIGIKTGFIQIIEFLIQRIGSLLPPSALSAFLLIDHFAIHHSQANRDLPDFIFGHLQEISVQHHQISQLPRLNG